MKKCLLYIGSLFAAMIICPAFQCADKITPYCEVYTQDTAILRFEVPENNGAFEVLDSIRILSSVSDTIKTVQGKVFLSPFSSMNANIQAYKVVTINNSSALNYANVEFNIIVNDGMLENSPSQGYTFLYRRTQPFNRLNVSFVPGFRGLYLFVFRNTSYFGLNIKEPNNDCAYYNPISFMDETRQQKQYWDSLGGISSLRLAGSNSFVVANKADRNYFFVRVN
jgi:hypothetical protein